MVSWANQARAEKTGSSGKCGSLGRGGSSAFRLQQDVPAMSHALLSGTVEKLEGKDEARKCAAAMASNILTKKAWVNHRRCEVEPGLDSPCLYLLVSCSKDPIHIALAKSWVTRTIANSDGGLATLGLERFSFRPGAVSLPTMRAAFCS